VCLGTQAVTANRIVITLFVFAKRFDLALSFGELYPDELFTFDLKTAFQIMRFAFNDQLALGIGFLNKTCTATFFEDPGGLRFRFRMSTFSA
jgi:hypothetical protein